MKVKKIAKLIEELNKSLINEPFEAQNLDAIAAFNIFGIETAADYDSFESSKEYTGINTRYGRGIYELLCKEYKVDKPYACQETIGGWRQRPIEFKSYDSAYDYAGHQSGCIEILPSLAVEIDYL